MPVLANPKHERFAQEYAKGSSAEASMLAAGYKPSVAKTQSHRLSENVLVIKRLEELLEGQLVTSHKLHRRWSEMFEADLADIITDTGKFKPIHEWPKIWRQMLTGMDVKELFERSKDGGEASWDQIGQIVKLKWVEQTKLGELLGKHRAVDAFVKDKQDVSVNVQVALIEDLQEGRRLALSYTTGSTQGSLHNTSTETPQLEATTSRESSDT